MNVYFRILVPIVIVFTLFPLVASVRSQDAPNANDARGDGTLRRIRVPVLMYHYVSPLPPDADDIRTELTIDPPNFLLHMQYLRDQGFNTISLYDLNAALLRGEPLPPNPVILTFDDGYIDHYTNVFPVLRDFGFTGTFFLITGRPDVSDAAYMSWEQIAEMARAGMSMEAHTKSHVDLRDRDADYLTYELLGSVESITAHTGIEPRMFAYPAGRYDANTLAILDAMSILRAVTTQPGTLHTTNNTLELARVRMAGGTDVATLAFLLQNS